MKIEVVVSASPELSELIGHLVAALQKVANPIQAVNQAPSPAPPQAPPVAPSLPAPIAASVPLSQAPVKYSDERLLLAQNMYERGHTYSEIAAEVNQLPGPIWNEKAAANTRLREGWQRIPRPYVAPVSASPPAPPPLRAGPPIFMDPDGKIPADFDQIVTWAGQRGIVFDGGNLDLVNRRRAGLGMKPFVCVPPRYLRRA